LLSSSPNEFIFFATTYPIFAQEIYENPRDETGRIVCANCHLSEASTSLRVPAAVMADSVFDVVVALPYEPRLKQVTANGQPGEMNIGAVVVLPEGFKLAPKDRIRRSSERKTTGVFVQPYSRKKQNILVVGPVAGEKSRQRLHFPILSPEPSELKESRFLTYPVSVGANRGRGQLYPNGQASNNNLKYIPARTVPQPSTYTKNEVNAGADAASNGALTGGTPDTVSRKCKDLAISDEKNPSSSRELAENTACIGDNEGRRAIVPPNIPSQLASIRRRTDGSTEVCVKYRNPDLRLSTPDYFTLASGLVPSSNLQIGASVSPGEALSMGYNYGGFGQNETEFVMQKPSRLEGIFLLFWTLTIGQLALISKKKQYEAVQAVELRF
jgi:hypothetical protein